MSRGSAIRPIETRYKGCRFRSRLEARWAVFFDAWGVAYEYEPQGYNLTQYGYGYYLPDFFLPELDLWVEVKPDVEEEIWRGPLSALCGEADEWTGAIMGGIPHLSDGDYYMEALPWTGLCSYEGWDEPYFWCECLKCGRIGYEWCGRAERNRCGCYEEGRVAMPNAATPRLVDAYEAARSARFEHGEAA